MSRPLVWIASAYLLGLTLGHALTYFPFSVVILLVLVIAAEMILKWQGVVLPNSNLLFGILLAGMAHLYLVTGYRPSNDISVLIDQGPVTLVGYIDEALVHYPDRSVVILKALQVRRGDSVQEVSGRVRVRGTGPFLGRYQYGDILQVRTSLRSPRGYLNPGLFQFGEYLRRQGIVAEATVSKPEDVTKIGRYPSVLREVYAWREKVRIAAHQSLRDAPLAIFLAMMIGETGYLTNNIRDHFMASGITHILSISGSHLGLLAIVVFPLARWGILSLPQGWLLRLGAYGTASQMAALITIFPVVFYALLAGGQVATVRSLIMILVYLLAILIQRQDDLLNALALATILVLLWDPRAIGEISFQLSYGSVLLMALAMEWYRRQVPKGLDAAGPGVFWERWVDKTRIYLVLTLAATLGTSPLVAYYFNQIGWVGIFSNLVVVPVAGLVIIPLGLFCALGSLIVNPPVLPLGDLLQGLYGFFYAAVRFFAETPGAELHIPSPSLFLIGVFYLSLLAVLLYRRRPGAAWALAGTLGLLVTMGVALFSHSGSLRIAFLDVGQGDAAVVQFPNGRVMVVDGGRAFGEYDLGRLVVAPYLWDQGIDRIDYLVATHPQLDHIGGLVFLMERFEVGEVWTNGVERETAAYQLFRSTMQQRQLIERRVSRQEYPIRIDSCQVHFLNPPSSIPPGTDPAPAWASDSENNRSIVLKLDCGIHSAMFTGDIEEEAERQLASLGDLLKSTLIKVPHHGSRGSLNAAFLESVAPRIAVISAGVHNSYGHPAPEVLAFYRGLDSEVFRTDQQGAILIELEDGTVKVRQFSDLVLHPVRWNLEMPLMELANLKRLVRPPFSLILDKGHRVK